jgi:hypothetical protein
VRIAYLNVARGLALAAAMACASSAGAAPLLTSAQLQADFRLAREALEEAHGGIYRYTAKPDLDRVFDAAAARLDHPMDAMEFLRILAPAIAAVRCGHTGIQLAPAMRKELEQALLLPLDVRVIGGRLFILRDYASAGALAGNEITAINGVAAASILATLTAAAPGDGFIPTGRAGRVGRTFKEGLYNYLDMHGRFALTLQAPESAMRTVELAGQPLAALRAASASLYPQDQRPKKFIDLSFLDEGRIARLQVFRFTDADEDDDGRKLLRQAFEKIAASGARTLLLDLRDNPGGEDALGKSLFAHLVDQPFPYYAELTVKRVGLGFASHVDGSAGLPAGALQARADGLYSLRAHANLGIQQPAAPAFKGRVIALINGGSFSTTAELISQLHDKKRAIFVGEESGGAYHGNSSGHEAALVLPNSGLRLGIPLVMYKLALGGSHPVGRGVTPEHPVQPAIGDFLAGRDPQWNRALSLARDGK